MAYTLEIDFTCKVLKNMQIDSHIITKEKISDYHSILVKNTISVVTDKFMCKYILFPLTDVSDSEIFICGPYITEDAEKNIKKVTDETVLFALFYALGESIWRENENRIIKYYIIKDGILTETEKDASSKKYSIHVFEAMSIIDRDLTADLSLKAVSGLLGINESYFSALFRKETGKTFTQFVNEKRIELAKKLFVTTSLQIQTVAQHCGILDVNYFSKLFRKHCGMSPSEFRNSIK